MIILYEKFREFENHVQGILENHVQGISPSRSDWQIVINSGIIIPYYKYNGTVWKVFFFYGDEFGEDNFRKGLKDGISKLSRQFTYSCTKNFDVLNKIKEDLGTGFRYYITVELKSNKMTCFFDVNKLSKRLEVENPYEHEEEVLLFADRINIKKSDIIDYGEL